MSGWPNVKYVGPYFATRFRQRYNINNYRQLTNYIRNHTLQQNTNMMEDVLINRKDALCVYPGGDLGGPYRVRHVNLFAWHSIINKLEGTFRTTNPIRARVPIQRDPRDLRPHAQRTCPQTSSQARGARRRRRSQQRRRLSMTPRNIARRRSYAARSNPTLSRVRSRRSARIRSARNRSARIRIRS